MSPEQLTQLKEWKQHDVTQSAELTRQLIADYERLTAGLGELEKRLRAESESHYCQEYNRELGKGFRACADELAALLRGNDDEQMA